MTSENRLAGETSPYLKQHADNPVDWYPWGEEALTLAREADKPILLSVGYSACHWCHVMAHESFEDAATAEVMNEHFVNIKVDREERPDIDRIYQVAHQLLTQRGGGWPLTMFIDPATQRPFFGGTYFPKDERYGMPAFSDLLVRVAGYFRDNRDDVREQGSKLKEIFGRMDPSTPAEGAVLDATPIAAARQQFAESFDRDFGGIGNQPKFPHPTTLERLMRDWRKSAHAEEPDIDALFLVSLTLTRMAEGGIYDQLGGGFCRYSVDRYWQIPHFEKMLYDNGPLLALYAQLYLATGDELYGRIANETADWILDDMLSPEGGFYSTRDADSEGEEGLFYVWTPDEVRNALEPAEYDLVARHYGLNGEANFEGKWHLTVREPLEMIAGETGETVEALVERLAAARHKLLQIRANRVAPERDEKQLTAWNALAIRGLAIAGRALSRPDLVEAAAGAARFVRSTLIEEGRLLAVHKDGKSRFPAYLDDHAFLLDALLELLQCGWDNEMLGFATELADLMLKHFYDAADGGFFFTADDHEQLMHRPKTMGDDATPSGNGIAAQALQRLGFLLGETRYLDAAGKTLGSAWQVMNEYPHGHVSLLTALEEYLEHPEIIIIRGAGEEVARWQESAARMYAPRRMVFGIPSDCEDLPAGLAEKSAGEDQTIAYRCVGSQCSLPLDSWEALAAELSETSQGNEA